MENKTYISAFMSSSIGLLAMSVVNIGTDANDGFKSLIHSLGKMWIPGADGIGPYSGKETVLLLFWAASWILLNYALKDRKTDVKRWFGASLVILGAATILMWPPIFVAIAHVIKG